MASDPLLLYFTSGTTAKPKLVEHTHASYPVGHLSTMYWIGLRPGDVHLNVSSPGWAKHAWSNVCAPWLAEACVMLFNFARFDAPRRHQTARRASSGRRTSRSCATDFAPWVILRLSGEVKISAGDEPAYRAILTTPSTLHLSAGLRRGNHGS